MLRDEDLDALTWPIIEIYERIERALLAEIASRLDVNDKLGGTAVWQLQKLDELWALNVNTAKIFAEHTGKTEEELRAMIEKAGFANIDFPEVIQAYKGGWLHVNPEAIFDDPALRRTVDSSFREIKGTFRMINTKAMDGTKSAYMDVLNRTYIEVGSGIYDYQTSIKRGLLAMADKGITAATYQREDGSTGHYSIEAAVRRDTLTAVHQAANRETDEACKRMGVTHVEVSSHVGARVSTRSEIANHAGWQGKVYKLEGFDDKYGNLKAHTGYPDDIQGLGGVNCRHRFYPFIPGVSKPVFEHYDEAEAAKLYKLTQKQRAKERRIRAQKRDIAVAKAAGFPPEDIKAMRKQLNGYYDDIIAFCKENGLKREYIREMIEGEK